MLCACRLTKRQHRRWQHLQAGIIEHQQQRQHAQSRLAVHRQLLRCGHTRRRGGIPQTEDVRRQIHTDCLPAISVRKRAAVFSK